MLDLHPTGLLPCDRSYQRRPYVAISFSTPLPPNPVSDFLFSFFVETHQHNPYTLCIFSCQSFLLCLHRSPLGQGKLPRTKDTRDEMRHSKQFGEIIRDSQDFGIGSLNGQLLLRLGNTLTKSYDFFHNRIGCCSPNKRSSVQIILLNKLIDFKDQFFDIFKSSSMNRP